jgi:glycosyltransferase involved in cell wall biosynthesis
MSADDYLIFNDWPKDVRSLRMPWHDSAYTVPDQEVVGVFLHIFYPELTEELLRSVANITVPVRVYVSTDTEEKRRCIADALDKAGFSGKYEIRVLPNRGWDIAPFLVGFADRVREHEIILRMHGKRSAHLSEGKSTEWRTLLLSSLAGSPDRVRSILAAFARCRNLGMVCPEHWHVILPFINAEADSKNMNQLLASFGCGISPADPIDFPSGSMFWCRSKALEPLLSQDLGWDDFEPVDSEKRWNTLAHAVERTFFFICGFAGFQWSRVPQLGVSTVPASHAEDPGVSILLTSYNYARYIGTTITSILSQTWTHWELIIIDDGSTDASVSLIESFAKEEPRIKLLCHPDGGNHGLAASLRYAMEHARYELVAFIESDDYWHEKYLEIHVKAMWEHNADVTYCIPAFVAQPDAYDRCDDFRRFLRACEKIVSFRDAPKSLQAHLHRRNIIPTMSCLVAKRSLFADCDWTSPVAPWLDWWLWMQISDVRFFRIPTKYVFWRVHAESYHSGLKKLGAIKKQYLLMRESYAQKSGAPKNSFFDNIFDKLNVYEKLQEVGRRIKIYIRKIKLLFDFLWTGGTVFMCNYPLPELKDGYFQRIHAIDSIFSKRWRIYFNIEYHTIGYPFFGLREEKALYVNARPDPLSGLLLMLFILRCRQVYFHSVIRLLSRWQRLVMKMPFVKKIWDVHGAVPEETAFQGDVVQARTFEKFEALAASWADVILVVSNAMGRHLCNKYGSSLEQKIVLLPIITRYKLPRNNEREEAGPLPKVIYAGGVDKWQQIPLMLETIAKSYDRASWHIFTQNPAVFHSLMPEELKNKDIPIQTATRDEMLRMYTEYAFGFILRDGNILNIVSCPTKLVEYIAMGVIPILQETRLGDFVGLGLQYVTRDDFVMGKIPDREERQKMRIINTEVYRKIYDQYIQGVDRLKDIALL